MSTPVYQIDFSATASGKRVAATKRRIRWRFGFANEQALAAGQTGTDCRGEEHDVTVVWSITSGKRQISMDGREIHYSTNRSGVLDFSWSTKGNHVVKVIGHVSPPMSATPGFRQYDLSIDGQSFFTMPKVYELGIRVPPSPATRVPGYGYGNSTSPMSQGGYSRPVGAAYDAPMSRDQEEQNLRMAIEASIAESRQHLSRGGDDRSAYTQPAESTQTGDLLDFGSPAPPNAAAPAVDNRSMSSMPSYYSAPPSYSQPPTPVAQPPYQSPPPIQQAHPVASPHPSIGSGALVPSHGPPGSYHGAPPATPSYASPPPVPPAQAPTPVQVPYAPAPAVTPVYANPPTQNGYVLGLNSPPEHDPFAPKPPPPPPKQDLASVILSAYQSPSGPTPPQTPGQPTPGQPVPTANGVTTASPQMTMNALATATDEPPKSEFETALQKLVNVDHIDEPAEGELKLTMMREEEAKKNRKGKSRPVPPVASGMIGNNATLSEIKSVKPSGPPVQDTEGKIMKPPPPGLFQHGAAYSGALVVHGQGPPPLNQPMGFGIGATLPNGGLSNQQQANYMGYPQQQYR